LDGPIPYFYPLPSVAARTNSPFLLPRLCPWINCLQIRYHDVNVREGATPDQLAIAVAKHFENRLECPTESECIKSFCDFVTGEPTDEVESDGDTRVSSSSSSGGGGGSNNGSNGNSDSQSRKRKRTHVKSTKDVANGLVIPGSEVAAKVKDTWIHARVVRWHSRTKRYEVEDADTESQTEKSDRYQVQPRHIIPLVVPKLAETFEQGERVLALFPWTTSFYAATVVSKGPKHEPGDKYGVRFDDDKEEGKIVKKRKIPRYFVVRYRD
jgi:hypothetical protein